MKIDKVQHVCLSSRLDTRLHLPKKQKCLQTLRKCAANSSKRRQLYFLCEQLLADALLEAQSRGKGLAVLSYAKRCQESARQNSASRPTRASIVCVCVWGGGIAEYWVGRAKKTKQTCDGARKQNEKPEHLEKE